MISKHSPLARRVIVGLAVAGVDLHKKWGRQPLKVPAPFPARYLRLRYHNDGQKTPVIRMPAALSVYDGPAEEAWEVPSVGKVIASGLLREDGSFKPSWFTYATLIRALHGATDGKRLPHADPNVRLYVWKRAGREVVLSGWAVEGSATLALDLGKCTATDAFGGSRETDLAKDKPLLLTEFPVYVSGISGSEALKRLLEAEVTPTTPAQ